MTNRLLLIALGFTAGLPLFAQSSCKPLDLAFDSTTTLTLSPTDCKLRELLATTFVQDAKAKVFSIPADTEGVLTIALKSPQFDPVVYLLDSDSRIRASAAGKNKEGKLQVHVPKGTFGVIVSASTVSLGDFQITASFEVLRNCEINDLIAGQTIQSTFTATSCRELDLTLYSIRETPVQLYRVKVPKVSILSLEMRSKEVDSAITILNSKNVMIATDDNGAGEKDSRILTSITAGEYILHVNSQDKSSGNFNLATKLEDSRPCPAKTLVSGTPVTAAFSFDGCRYLDLFVPSTRTSPMDRYEFTNEEKGWIDLTLNGAAIQPSLMIFDAMGALQTRQTALAQGQKSQIVYSMKPGTYTLFATTVGNLINDYSLNLQINKPSDCKVQSLPAATEIRSLENPNACRVLDFVIPSRDTGLAEAFRISGNKPRMLKSLLQSSMFDGYLYLMDNNGTIVLENDDDGGGTDGTDSLINSLIPEGEHTLVVTSFDGSVGDYKIATTVSEARNCDSGSLSLTATKSAAFTASDCVAREAIPYFDLDYQTNLYSLNVPVNGTISISAKGNGFPMFSVVFNERFVVYGLATTTATGPLEIKTALPAGRYSVAMFAPEGRIGQYSATVDFLRESGPISTSLRTGKDRSTDFRGKGLKELIFPASQSADEINVPFQKIKRR